MTGRRLFVRLHMRTLILLGVLICLAIFHEYFTQNLGDGGKVIEIINKAGRQRMYCQRINFLAENLVHRGDTLGKKEMKDIINRVQSVHNELISIRESIIDKHELINKIDTLMYATPDTLDSHLTSFLSAAQTLSNAQTVSDKEKKVAEYLRNNANSALLIKLEKAVEIYTELLTARLSTIHWFDKYDLAIIIAIICIAWVFVVFPFNKELQEEMRKNEEIMPRLHLLSFVAEKTQNTVIITDVNGETLWVNSAFTELTGYTLEEMKGKRPGSVLMSEKTNKDVLAAINEAMEYKKPYNNEILNKTKDGREYWTQLHIDPIFDENNVLTGFLSVEFDITEHRAAEKKISTTAELLQQLMENIFIGVLVEDEKRTVTYVNSSLCTMFQLPLTTKEAIGDNCVHTIAQARILFGNPDTFMERINEILTNRTVVYDEQLSLSDGRFFERTYVPIQPYESVEWNMWLYRDITQRKVSEEALRKSEASLQKAHTIAKLASFETEADGVRDYWSSNPSVAFGFSEPLDMDGLNLKKLVSDDVYNEIVKAWSNAVLTHQPFDIDFPLKHDNGTIHYVRCIGEPVFDENGRYIKMLGIVQNITEEKRAEIEIVKAKEESERANRAKSAFLSSMTHELRTPLNAIIGFSQILQEDEAIPHKQRGFISAMYKSGQHLHAMINDVLDMSKIEADKLEFLYEPFSLDEIVDDLASIFSLKSAQKSISFYVIKDSVLPKYIVGDKKRLKQVCINLIGNSVKFTQKGFIEFSVKKISEYEHEESKAVEILFAVKDTGKGIPKDRLPTIFEPFSQVESLHSEGTGLGLAISSRIIRGMGGNITVMSEEDKGTEFAFTLRFKYYEKAKREAESEKHLIVSGIKNEHVPTVLLVDDIESNLLVHKALLRRVGFDCLMTQSATSAISIAKESKPDIIITDVMMAGKNGIQMVQEIRNEEWGRDIPIIALTANGRAYKKDEMLVQGFSEFIVKPFRMDELFKAIEHCSDIQFVWKSKIADEKIPLTQNEQIDAVMQFIDSLDNEMSTNIKEAIEFQYFDKIEQMLSAVPIQEKEKHQFAYEHLLHAAKEADFTMMIKLSEAMV